MNSKLHRVLLLTAIALIAAVASACGKAASSAPAPTVPSGSTVTLTPPLATRTNVPASPMAVVPTEMSVQPTSASTPIETATSPKQSAKAGYDGDWNGTTSSDDMPISFTVDNGQVTFVNLGYSVQSDGCSLSGSLSKSVTEQIAANAFSIQLSDDDGKAYAFAGTLTADGKASGTINVKGTSQSCGAFDSKATWQAKLGQDDSSSSQGN